MSVTKTINPDVLIPTDIADTVIKPTSYSNHAKVQEAFTWLRKNKPLGVACVDGYDPIWVVTKLQDILFVERDPMLYTSSLNSPMLNDIATDDFLRSMNGGSIRSLSSLVYMDPPEHVKLRKITSRWFMPKNIGKLEALIGEIADEFVEKFLSFDGECDYYSDFALYYPLRVIMALFGVPQEDEAKMHSLTQDLFGAHDPETKREGIEQTPEAAAMQWQSTLNDFFSYFNELTADRRKNPKDDLLSLIANTKFDGEYIGEKEANGYYVTIATAGHDSTSMTTASSMHALINNPDQLAELQADSSKIPSFVEEGLRWASPIKHFMRTASRDTELSGQAIAKGDRLFLSFPSGNRDEEMFDDPFKFDINRKPNRHLAFGSGQHLCLGMHLAKLELRLLHERLLPHIKTIELASEPKYLAANFTGGLKSLPIRFTTK